jgi:PTH2 family peptidyl-tRNA hydrolase
MDEYKQIILIRKDLGMTCGKMIAQGSHASHNAARQVEHLFPMVYQSWFDQGYPKIVLRVNSEKELMGFWEDCVADKIPCAYIVDRGSTQVPNGSVTACALGPWRSDILDKMTGDLKLL